MSEITESAYDQLKPRQRAFVDYFIETGNETEAYKRAGYNAKNDNSAAACASKLLRNAKVAAAIAEIGENPANERIASRTEVLETLTRVLRREEEETVVVTVKKRHSYYDEKGKKVIEESEEPMLVKIPSRVCDANKAAELLGRSYQMYTDKVDITSPITLVFSTDYGDQEG